DHHNTTNNANASSSSAAMGNQVTCSSGCSPAEDDRGVIKLVLDTPVGDKVLYYRRRNTEAGKRWFSEVRRTTKANLPIKDDWRIYNAPGGPTTGKLISDLMKVIDVINSYSPGTIPKDAAVLSETMPLGGSRGAEPRPHARAETMMLRPTAGGVLAGAGAGPDGHRALQPAHPRAGGTPRPHGPAGTPAGRTARVVISRGGGGCPWRRPSWL
ncbi:unnamed protein product, partial [Heterosigma akashiwo]